MIPGPTCVMCCSVWSHSELDLLDLWVMLVLDELKAEGLAERFHFRECLAGHVSLEEAAGDLGEVSSSCEECRPP